MRALHARKIRAALRCIVRLSASTDHLLGHDGRGIRQAAISQATGDLRNLPGSLLYTQCKLKWPLIVVGRPKRAYGLEQQVSSRRSLAHLTDPAVDDRDASRRR